MQEFLENIVTGIDPVNAAYILQNHEIVNDFAQLERQMRRGKIKEAAWRLRHVKRLVREFQERHLVPSGIKPGDGVTVDLWTDGYAATVIKVTKNTVTVRRDTAILDPNFKPEFIPGGFGGHCINQDKQAYSYRPNPDGTIYKFRWSNKFQSYGQPGSLSLRKGRHEFYDYNF